MKIQFAVEVPYFSSKTDIIELSQLGITEEEWAEMSQEDKEYELCWFMKKSSELKEHIEDYMEVFNYKELND